MDHKQMNCEETAKSMFYETIRINTTNDSECDTLVDNYLMSLKILSEIIKESMYVIDFHQKCFRFVSDKGAFLCGYSSEEVLQWGYYFYIKVVHPKDLQLIVKIHQVIFDFFSHPDISIHDLACIVFNFRIRSGKGYLMVSHRVVPVVIKNNVRLAFCVVTDSVLKTSGNLYAYFKNEELRYKYSFESDRWSLDTPILLSEKEKDILKWGKQGKTVKEIADVFCLSDKTIRNQKVILFEKADVKNMLQAILFAENHFLI